MAQPLLDGQRGQDGPLGVVLIGRGDAHQRHETVAEELVDRPSVALDLRLGELEEPAEEAVHGLGPEALRESRRADDVAEQHRHRLVLALRGGAGARLVGGCERRPARAAEAPSRVDPATARRTGGRERGAAVLAEPSAVRVRASALSAMHDAPAVPMAAPGRHSPAITPPRPRTGDVTDARPRVTRPVWTQARVRASPGERRRAMTTTSTVAAGGRRRGRPRLQVEVEQEAGDHEPGHGQGEDDRPEDVHQAQGQAGEEDHRDADQGSGRSRDQHLLGAVLVLRSHEPHVGIAEHGLDGHGAVEARGRIGRSSAAAPPPPGSPRRTPGGPGRSGGPCR